MVIDQQAATAGGVVDEQKGNALSKLQTKLQALEDEANGYKGDIKALKGDIKTLKGEIEKLNGKKDKSKDDEAEIGLLQADIRTLRGMVADLIKLQLGSLSLAVPTCGASSISPVAWWR